MKNALSTPSHRVCPIAVAIQSPCARSPIAAYLYTRQLTDCLTFQSREQLSRGGRHAAMGVLDGEHTFPLW